MDVYEALFVYFSGLPIETVEITLTFTQVERIMGSTLPATAWHYRTWWEHPGGRRMPSQVRAWMRAGWYVEMVDQHKGRAWFRRTQ